MGISHDSYYGFNSATSRPKTSRDVDDKSNTHRDYTSCQLPPFRVILRGVIVTGRLVASPLPVGSSLEGGV